MWILTKVTEVDGESLRSYGYGAQDSDDRMLYTYRAKGQNPAKMCADVTE